MRVYYLGASHKPGIMAPGQNLVKGTNCCMERIRTDTVLSQGFNPLQLGLIPQCVISSKLILSSRK